MRSRWLISVLFFAAAARAEQMSPIADKDVQALADKRIAEWQPTAEEKRFDEIGWCTSLLQAEELAAKHKRPIFLFTHDGKMQVGRC
jgi:hypothetical protein